MKLSNRGHLVTRPGLYEGVPDDVYHLGRNTPEPSVSQSQLKLLVPPSRPAHFKYRLANREGPRREFDVGRAAHTTVLGVGEPMAACPADLLSVDGKMTTRDAKAWNAAQRALGIVPLTPADHQRVLAMAEALSHNGRVAEILTDPTNLPEVSAYAVHPDHGLWVRGRFDLLGGRPWDYKTSKSADPAQFERSAWRYGYHIQDRIYRWLFEWIHGVDPGRLVFIAQEKEPPYLVSTTSVDDGMEAAALIQAERAFTLLVECMASDHWPGYPEEVVPLRASRWALRELGLDVDGSPLSLDASPAETDGAEALDAETEAAFDDYLEGLSS